MACCPTHPYRMSPPWLLLEINLKMLFQSQITLGAKMTLAAKAPKSPNGNFQPRWSRHFLFQVWPFCFETLGVFSAPAKENFQNNSYTFLTTSISFPIALLNPYRNLPALNDSRNLPIAPLNLGIIKFVQAHDRSGTQI